MKQQSMFAGMLAFEVIRNINDDISETENEKCFTQEVLGGPMTSNEIADFFLKTELPVEKGWRLISTEYEYSREHENYLCPYSYYYISARFVCR